MNIRLASALAAALFFVGVPQIYAQDEIETEATPISVVGCVQRETEYRRQNNSGLGGFLGFGGGLGDEYVLVNASRGADGAFGDCTTRTGGEAYELTGSTEEDLEQFVGQRVAISGTRKAAEIDAATGQPTGGRQAGDDLRLFEVEVDSFRAFSAPVQTGTVTRLEQEPTRLEQEPPRREPDSRRVDDGRVDTSAAQRDRDVDRDFGQLPRTASPLVLTGLISLLSLAGVIGVRALQRHDQV